MPIHIHPVLRAREEALELEGIIPVRDSVAVSILKTQEALGQRGKIVPVARPFVIRGTQYIPK